ncbi:hypothetical protein VTO73DRAFT_12370 [Trametes versicolor]
MSSTTGPPDTTLAKSAKGSKNCLCRPVASWRYKDDRAAHNLQPPNHRPTTHLTNLKSPARAPRAQRYFATRDGHRALARTDVEDVYHLRPIFGHLRSQSPSTEILLRGQVQSWAAKASSEREDISRW